MNKKTNISPWLWVPTLYFAEGLPYFIVNNISVTMFTRLGVPNGEMALFTSLLYLPWTLKPLWSPLVDIFKSKRWWIVIMQALVSAALIILSLSLPRPEQGGQATMGLFTATLILFLVAALASATHDIAADGYYMLCLDSGDQAFFVGIRSTFYRLSSVFAQGALVYLAGVLELSTSSVPRAWGLTLLVSSLIFLGLTIYHSFVLPSEKPAATKAPSVNKAGFLEVFVSFFKKKGVWLALAFMLLYRLPEAFLLKMVNPFLLDPASKGGLAMGTSQLGLVYGTIGVIALTVGGILGGIYASRKGLKRSLLPMSLLLTLPCACYVFMAAFPPSSLWLISALIAFEQFGYGFGFTAYMLYMMYFSQGEYKTSHYALCTAFMALSMMLPGMFAGYIQQGLNYFLFFVFVMLCCLPALAVTLLVRRAVDDEYGIKL